MSNTDHGHDIIGEILSQNTAEMGSDYEKYKNHVYRVFFLCRKMDNAAECEEKYAIAAAFHDLGIWTNKTFDYLAPSIQKAQEYLKTNGKTEWNEEISLMIEMHHKTSTYKGRYAKTVETFRRADWIEVTMGVLTFNTPRKERRALMKRFPNAGFHWFLVIQTLRNFIRHPLNPLPMFRR